VELVLVIGYKNYWQRGGGGYTRINAAAAIGSVDNIAWQRKCRKSTLTAKFAVHPAGASKSIGNIQNEFIMEDLLEQPPRGSRGSRTGGGRKSAKKTTLSKEEDKFDDPNDVDRIVDEVNSDGDLGETEVDSIV
jgi:hypothetical protein